MWGDPCRLDVPSTRTVGAVGAQCAVRRFDRHLRRRARWRWPSALATRRVRLERWWSNTHPVATGPWLAAIVKRSESGRVTLVYAARDRDHNNAVALRNVIEGHGTEG